jgi:hypothetical protein
MRACRGMLPLETGRVLCETLDAPFQHHHGLSCSLPQHPTFVLINTVAFTTAIHNKSIAILRSVQTFATVNPNKT